jgi:addiction module RelB/DinJ family antitoxin
MKTMLNIKLDKKLKEKAKKVARDLGLPLNTIINRYLKDLIHERRVIFADHPMPGARFRKILSEILGDVRAQKNTVGPFSNADDMIKSLKQ